MIAKFGLGPFADMAPDDLPLGIRQRLQLAVAVQHEPELLILDEPTSGVDPIARDQFWQFLVDLSRNDHVTIFLSTHFMSEAARCDRISLMHAGTVLALDTPKAIMESREAATLEDAFIAYLRDAEGVVAAQDVGAPASGSEPSGALPASVRRFDARRLWAYARRETVEILRDPLRMAFAFLGPLILMVAFGYGISFDVEDLHYAAFDQDQSLESRQLLESFEGSRYFRERPPITGAGQLESRLSSGELTMAIEIPPGFGRDLLAGNRPEVGVWLDGSMPFHAETTSGYVTGIAQSYLADQTMRRTGVKSSGLPVIIETRFRYNQAFMSVYAIVPSVIMLMLVLIPAINTAVAVVREVETGSIANFRSSPVTSLEFLLGKQAPYVAIGLLSFVSLCVEARLLFGVPVKGSLTALTVGALLYVFAATGFGLVVSTFTRTQVAAVFATAIIAIIPAVNFSGLLVPVSSLTGAGRLLGLSFPASWFQLVSVGTFTKGLGFQDLWMDLLALAAFTIVFIAVASVALRKQEA